MYKFEKYFLPFILLLGLSLRGLNSTFGSSSLYALNDEAIAHLAALNMVANKTLSSIAYYPPLGAYLQLPFIGLVFVVMKILGIVKNISDFEFLLLTHQGYLLFIPRIISAFFGALSILVLYKITKFLFGKREIALTAAFLAAVSFNLVHASHFAKPWPAAIFFFLLAVYLALKNKVFWSFLSAVISFGFLQIGVFALPIVLLIFWKDRTKILPYFAITVLLIIVFNQLTTHSTPQDALLKFGRETFVWNIARGTFSMDSVLKTFMENNTFYFVRNILVTDFVIFVFALLSLVHFAKFNFYGKLILFYITAYFLLASVFLLPHLHYLLPITALLIPFAAFGVYRLINNDLLGQRKTLKFLLLAVTILSASTNSVYWNWLYLKTPTFIQVHQWIESNLAKNTPIAYLGGRYQTFVPNRQAIDYLQNINPTAYGKLKYFLPERDSENIRNIIFTNDFYGKDKIGKFKNATKNYPVDYVVDYYLNLNDRIYLADPSNFEIVAHFNPIKNRQMFNLPEPLFEASSNFPTAQNSIEISMYQLERIGPYFDVLKVK